MKGIEIKRMWYVLYKHWAVVILVPIVFAAASLGLSYYVLQPKYEAQTSLLINQQHTSSSPIPYDVIMANEALINTYRDIIQSRTIEHGVIQKLGLHLSSSQLNSMVQVSSPNQSQVIEISVTSPKQSLSAKIANTLGASFQKTAQSLMAVQSVEVVDPAITVKNASPVYPNKKLNLAISIVIGLIVAVGSAFILEYFDTRVRNEEDVQRYFDLPVLGSVGEL